jgi:hypothetical protein
MIVIMWLLDLQLPMQSVPITTNIVSSNSANGEVHSIQHHVINTYILYYIYIYKNIYHTIMATTASWKE